MSLWVVLPAVLAVWFAGLPQSALAQVQPPPGITWSANIADGKADAQKRDVPIFMLVGDATGNTKTIAKALTDARVKKLLEHFACVFVARALSMPDFQSSYVPWIGPTAQTTHRAPILIFGTPKGEVKQEYRIEGKGVSSGELAAQLEKVLKALAPNAYMRASEAGLRMMNGPQLCVYLGETIDKLDATLNKDTLRAFKEAGATANKVADLIKSKLRGIKDRKRRSAAGKTHRALAKALRLLLKYRGKKDEQFRKHLTELRTQLETLQAAFADPPTEDPSAGKGK